MEYMKLLSSAAVQPNNGIIKQHGHSMKIIYILLSILLILINPVSATTIMPLGDSITAESDSYRIKLLSLLSENGYNPVFVGSLSDATSRHEGHWGWRSYQISWNTASFISANPADNVLLHIGTNDVTYARTQGFTSPYDYAYAKPLLKEIVADIHNVSPDTKIFVSTIIPQKNCMYINETYYCGLTDLVKDYNSMIKDTANEMIMSGLPVYLVEMENAGIDVNIDLKDSVHPNILGSDKMAYVWYNAIKNASSRGEVSLLPGEYKVSFNIKTSIINKLIIMLFGEGQITNLKVEQVIAPTPTPTPTPTPIQNVIKNPTFDNTTYWNLYASSGGSLISNNGVGKITITNAGTNIQLTQSGLTLSANTKYQLSFDAWTSRGQDFSVRILKHISPYTTYSPITVVNLDTTPKRYSINFTASGFSGTVYDGRLQFWMAQYAKGGDVYYIDNVILQKV